MTEHYCIITFNSTHTAIDTEQKLLAAGLKVRLIPVPTQITAGCGLSLRFAEKDCTAISALMPELSRQDFYRVERKGRVKRVMPFFNC